MKTLSQTKALIKLQELKTAYQKHIRENFEHRAKNCLTCSTRGICCTDAHFVNVQITKLEAVAIRQTLKKLGAKREREILRSAAKTIENYNLTTEGDTFSQKFACPLFEKGIGCLVHFEGKPAPCIQHACYENREDLPPDELQEEVENRVERLNRLVYRQTPKWLPLPIWLNLIDCENQD
jgi:hypothetical protein